MYALVINYYRYLDKMLNLCMYCTYCSDDHNFFIFNFYWLYTQYIGQGRQGNVAPVIPVYGIYISEGFQFFGLGNFIASTASPMRGIRIFGECEEFRQIIYNTYLLNLNFQKWAEWETLNWLSTSLTRTFVVLAMSCGYMSSEMCIAYTLS